LSLFHISDAEKLCRTVHSDTTLLCVNIVMGPKTYKIKMMFITSATTMFLTLIFMFCLQCTNCHVPNNCRHFPRQCNMSPWNSTSPSRLV